MQNMVNIRPDVQMLGLLRNYNYTTWHALAEYVDNSVQSFLHSKETLNSQMAVDVDIRLDRENNSIVIRDNAGGIHKDEFPRAFKTGTPPSETDLNEFGVGMKVASCWWADKWTVKTKVQGETVAHKVVFDMEKIISEGTENLEITEVPEDVEKHYTEISLNEIRQPFPNNGSTKKKIKSFLSDTYQKFIEQGELNLVFDGEPLEKFSKPKVLVAPFFSPENVPVDDRMLEWKVDLDIDLGEGQTAKGQFILLAEKAGHMQAGLRLFRNGRIIQGASEDTYSGYYPRGIFAGVNSNERLRISGELTLEGFEVTSSKDAVKWDNKKVSVNGEDKELDEDTFCDLIKLAISEQGEVGEKFMRQARDIRVEKSKKELKKSFVQATRNTGNHLERKSTEIASEIDVIETTSDTSEPLPEVEVYECRPVKLEHDGITWNISIKAVNNEDGDWLEISNSTENENEISLEIQVSALHPFMKRYARNDDTAEGFLKMAAIIALSETSAQRNGYVDVNIIRETMNRLLKVILA